MEKAWRVLLIDDSEISLEIAKEALIKGGFDVRATTSLERFGEVLGSWSPEVILTDVNMPGMTGSELCRALKRRYETAHVPIVLCSSMDEAELGALARDCDADGFVPKTDMDHLADELRAVCETMSW
ncbi:MAG TPA: response regulator [Polyangiaceae bacterium]|nr:response regulator [Polyangiaceae bacterium]